MSISGKTKNNEIKSSIEASNTQSLNQNIVSEFEKLVSFVQLEIDQAKERKNQKEAVANSFRLKQIKNALATIKKYPKNKQSQFLLLYIKSILLLRFSYEKDDVG